MSIARKAVDDPGRTLALDERGSAALVPKPLTPEPLAITTVVGHLFKIAA